MHICLAASTLPNALIGIVAALAGLVIGVFQEPLRESVRRWRTVRRRMKAVEGKPEMPTRFSEKAGVGPVTLSVTATATLENLARDPIKGPRIYISEIGVDSFRCFEHVAVSLNQPGSAPGLRCENVNLIVGDNGTGKSTLLKAIAVAALGPVLDSSGFVPYRLIRTHEQTAYIDGAFVIDDPDQEPTRLRGQVEITRRGDYERVLPLHDEAAWAGIFDESNLSFLVLGYGVNRRVAEKSDRGTLERSRRRRRYERISSLFDENAVLTPLSAWLPELRPARRREVEEILAVLLPDVELAGSTTDETIFATRGQEVPYRALSDGYRSFIGWIGDLLFQIDSASDADLPFGEVGGIVLVDEVDLLLHPAWQREVVPNIARALPKLQFVFTTHSPIVAGTLESANVLLARTMPDGNSTVERLDAEIHGLNAEQILLSSYFDLESTRAPDVQQTLSTLAQQAMDGDDDAAVRYLRALAGEHPHFESST